MQDFGQDELIANIDSFTNTKKKKYKLRNADFIMTKQVQLATTYITHS